MKQVWTKEVNLPLLKKDIAIGTLTTVIIAIIYAGILTFIRVAMVLERHEFKVFEARSDYRYTG